jgi:diguanylate cyclase (GGDEF)-like protein/PAS domain S-box-containing protein
LADEGFMALRAKFDLAFLGGRGDVTAADELDDLLHRAFDGAAIGMGMISLEPSSFGRLIAANPSLSEITGHAPDELIGLDVADLGLAEDHAETHRRLARVMTGEVQGYRVERAIVRANGALAWIQVDVSAVEAGAGEPRCAVVNVQDVTERQYAAQRADARVVVTRILSQSSTVDGAISALVPALAQALGFEIGAAWTLDSSQDALCSHALWRAPSTAAAAFCGLTREVSLPRGVGLPGRVWETGAPQSSEDIAGDLPCPRTSAADADGLRSAVAFPVRVGSDFAGVVELVSTRRRSDDHALVELLAEIGPEMSDLLARKRAQEHVAGNTELLLVEDNAFIARLVHEMLSASEIDLDLVHVERLSDACDRILASPPACVLLDLTLPDADGLQSLLQLRKLAPDTPIVVLTGLEDEELAVRAVQEGAQDYLVKRRVDLDGLARSLTYAIERKGAERQLLEHRLRDRLTGLPNRVLFLDRLRVALARNERGRVAVLLVNLDRFRVVNDSMGHESGDRVLLEVADRLSRACGPRATVAGLGGDEFAVLLEPVDERTALAVAERVAESLQAPVQLGDDEILVSATLGIALNGEEADAQLLMAEADTAMSRGKELGGDCSEVFEEEVRERVRERLRLETGLRNAIERGELRLFYQPIVRLDTRAVVAFEALVRWQHPDQGLLPPAEFMLVAEESGLIVPMGEWVLNEACAQLAAWHVRFPDRDLTVNVNLSARQLGDRCLEEKILAAVHRHALAPGRLCLEVTETALVENIDAALPRLHALKSQGIGLALDDFGTGYSSLSYLQRFPIDVLKLDRSFVTAMRERDEDAIVAGVANMATALGLPPLAEGIEVEEDVARLQALGYTYGQGYLFARPQEPNAAIRLLEPGAVRA